MSYRIMAKRVRLRRDDACSGCGVFLAAPMEAYWLPTERTVRCLSCGAAPQDPASPPDPTPTAGASASREYERRVQHQQAAHARAVANDEAWRSEVRERRPVLGRIATGIVPRPKPQAEKQSTTAWKRGAEGEQVVGEALARIEGIAVLHDRLVPGSRRSNIDHIAVGPSAVFVIDAKKYQGRLEIRDVGGWRAEDRRLFVAGRDRSRLIDGVRRQVHSVEELIADEFPGVSTVGVLCFVGADWGLTFRPKDVAGVFVTWPKALAAAVARTAEPPLPVDDLAAMLGRRLKPAVHTP